MLRECLTAAGSLHGHICETELKRVFVDFARRLSGFAHIFRVELIEIVPQVAEPSDSRRERAEAFDLRDDDGERGEHCGKGSLRLRDDAKLDAASHKHRADDDARDDEGEVVVSVGKKAEVPRPADNPKGVLNRVVEPLDEIAVLALFPTEKGDGFRVVSNPDEAIAERRLFLILVEIQPDQPPPEQHGDNGADGRVEKQHAHELSRDDPQYAEKPNERHRRVHDHEEEIQHAGREKFHVFRDTLVRVIDGFRSADAVVCAIEKVALDEYLREPPPPSERQALLRITVVNANGHGDETHRDEFPNSTHPCVVVPLSERGDEIAHGVAQKYLHHPHGDAEPEQCPEPESRLPLRSAVKERLGEGEKFLQQDEVLRFVFGHYLFS